MPGWIKILECKSRWIDFHVTNRTGLLRAVLGELLANLTSQYAGLKPHLYNEQGKLRSFVNVYLNDEDIRYLDKEKTAVKPGDTVSIIPSVAGGR